jgi:hypothetical protein
MSNCPRLTSAAPTNVDAADRVSCRPSRAIENTFGRSAVGCPACVADADGTGERIACEPRFEVAQLALGTPAGELTVFQGGDAGRIVSSVFEPLEGMEERARDRLTSENAHNSAHTSSGLLSLVVRVYNSDDDVSAVSAAQRKSTFLSTCNTRRRSASF